MHALKRLKFQHICPKKLSMSVPYKSVPNVFVQCLQAHTARRQPEEVTPETDKRILYNCMLSRLSKHEAVQLQRAQRKARREQPEESSLPGSIFLNMMNHSSSRTEPEPFSAESPSPEGTSFPYASTTHVQFTSCPDAESAGQGAGPDLPGDTRLQLSVRERVRLLREQAVREEAAAADGADQDQLWVLRYGWPDPSVPASRAVCGGCGAHLHCQQPAWPGYLPAEVLRAAPEHELRDVICQRCYFLRFHQAAVNVTVPEADYSLMMRRVERWPALLVLVVDLLDFPCSVWPGVAQLVGESRGCEVCHAAVWENLNRAFKDG